MPFDAPEAARFVVFLTEEELHKSWRFVQPDGNALIKGDAAVALLTELRATHYLGRILNFLHLQPLVGLIYLAISHNRPHLSRLIKNPPPTTKVLPPDGNL